MMCRHILYLFIFVFLTRNAGGNHRYEYKYSADAKGWLRVLTVPATFHDAVINCHRDRAVLSSPSNKGLLEALKRKFPEMGYPKKIYTGIHATISRGHYASIEGIPLARIPVEWAPGEPKDYNEEEGCLVLLESGKLTGARCDELLPYICFKKNIKNHHFFKNECGTMDTEYKLDARTGSCYKFHRTGMSWRRAYSVCQAEGGNLAIINSDVEAQVLKELLERNPADTVFSKNKYSISVGVLNWGNKGFWYTVQGEKLEDSGYHNWSLGQPDNYTDNDPRGENCGTIFRNLQFNDVPCDNLDFPFICEMNPATMLSDDII